MSRSTTYDPNTVIGPAINPLDAHALFVEDLIFDERDFPQIHDPERIPVWEIHFKDHVDERTPDIVTKRTKAYLVAWELRKDHPVPPFR